MSSTISSSPTDGPQESPGPIDSRNPSRQTSYHEGDVPAFSPRNSWLPPMPPANNFPIPHVQSMESMQTALSAPSTLMSDPSPLHYYAFPAIIPPDHADAFAMCHQTGSWTSLPTDTANGDRYYDLHASPRRTDSTLSAEMVRNARASFPLDVRSKSPLKGESDRASRSRSIVGIVSPPADGGVRKLRKNLHGSSSRRNSIPLVSSAANVKAPQEIHARRHSPAKEEVVSNDEMSSEDEDSRYRPKSAGKEPTFACPFYRRWPTRHLDCMSRKLTRIQDVKQHIYRRHSKSPFYCPTCDKVFPSPDPRDDHIRQASCTPATATSKRSSDGISAQVHDSLKNRFSRRLTPLDQWYGIWDLIFPEEARPLNAYVGNVGTEMLSMLKDFWKSEGQRILPNVARPRTARTLTNDELHLLMAQMLDKVKDHFEDEPGKPYVAATDGTDSQGDQMMDRSPVDSEPGALAEYEEVSYEQSPPNGWEAISYSPNGSPPITIGGRIIESSIDLGSSGMLVEQQPQPYTEQPWMNQPMANPIVNSYQ